MPRRPEIGNIQLYPDRPLRRSDRNGYVLKFYCPLLKKRVRKNCGTRDRREASRILRECRERLLNGEYVNSGGSITALHSLATAAKAPVVLAGMEIRDARSWDECVDRYREHRTTRVRKRSLEDALYRINLAERILVGHRQDRGQPEGLLVSEAMTLDMLEYLQDRLLAGDECLYDSRSPSTVNSTMGAVMAFVRFCHKRGWIPSVPPIEKLDVEEVMKGRPITLEEFERMLKATPKVVGPNAAESWKFALRVLWESGFRTGDLMDFHWVDDRHIHPVWPTRTGQHPTIAIPSSQKNGLVQEIPMLPGLQSLLRKIPPAKRTDWVVSPAPMEYELPVGEISYRPSDADLRSLARRFSNRVIAQACCVSDMSVRKWLKLAGIERRKEFRGNSPTMSQEEMEAVRRNAVLRTMYAAQRITGRLTKERVSRVIALIGKEAGIVVRKEDARTGAREKFASAHDLRRGCAQRLINAGISAETLKIVMRHEDFATTEKHYGAIRSAQSAASELVEKMNPPQKSGISGGISGGTSESPQLSAEEVMKLKSLLNSI